MSALEVRKLLMLKWGREFNDPPITDEDVKLYTGRLDKYDFTDDEIAAGIERYAETFTYGQRRNWAFLLSSINEIRNAGLNIMPAGVAADHFSEFYGGWNYRKVVANCGYAPISVKFADETIRVLGRGIGQEEPKYARLKFMQVYEKMVARETSIEYQSAKRLSAAVKEREQLASGNNRAAGEIRKLSGGMKP